MMLNLALRIFAISAVVVIESKLARIGPAMCCRVGESRMDQESWRCFQRTRYRRMIRSTVDSVRRLFFQHLSRPMLIESPSVCRLATKALTLVPRSQSPEIQLEWFLTRLFVSTPNGLLCAFIILSLTISLAFFFGRPILIKLLQQSNKTVSTKNTFAYNLYHCCCLC